MKTLTRSTLQLSLLALICFAVIPAYAARIVNIEIDPRDPPDPVYNGDDGVLSSPGGTVWNHVGLNFLADVNVNNLRDEFGTITDIDVTFDAAGSIDSNFRPIELYAGGGIGVLEIKSLSATSIYDLAIYTHDPNLSVTVTDLSGSTTKATGATFSIELPGDEGEEYVLYSGLVPYDLGGGLLGLTVETNGAVRMAGLQLREIPEPATLMMLVVGNVVLFPHFFRRSQKLGRSSFERI